MREMSSHSHSHKRVGAPRGAQDVVCADRDQSYITRSHLVIARLPPDANNTNLCPSLVVLVSCAKWLSHQSNFSNSLVNDTLSNDIL